MKNCIVGMLLTCPFVFSLCAVTLYLSLLISPMKDFLVDLGLSENLNFRI